MQQFGLFQSICLYCCIASVLPFTIWEYESCYGNLGISLTLTYYFPMLWLILILLIESKLSISTCCTGIFHVSFLTTVTMFGFNSVYLLFMIHTTTPTCLSRWILYLDFLAVALVILPLLWMGIFFCYVVGYLLCLSPLQRMILERRKKRAILALYERNPQAYAAVHDARMTQDISNMPIMREELSIFERLFKKKIPKESEVEMTEQVDCVACGRKVSVCRSFFELPSCGHHYDRGCMDKLIESNCNQCEVCGNNIRKTCLKLIHSISQDSSSFDLS